MKRTKQNGITLIALVITIIILLILAGITIAAVTSDNGIIKNANNAKEQTEISNEKEVVDRATIQAMSNNKRGNLVEDELQKQLDNIAGKNKTCLINGLGEHIIVKFTDSDRYYLVDIDGNVKEYDYKQSIEYYANNGELKVGDYIDYNIENYKNDGLFAIDSTESGYTTEQIFNVKNYTGTWRILYNGTENYGIQIISNSNVLGENEKIKFTGKTGYNNFVQILNRISENYIEPNLAKNSRSLGSNPMDTENSIGNTSTIKDSKPNDDTVWNLVEDYKNLDEDYKFDEAQLKILNSNNYQNIFFASRNLRFGYHYGRDASFWSRSYKQEYFGEFDIVNTNGNHQEKTTSTEFIPVIKLNETIKVEKTIDSGKTIWKITGSI